MPRRPQGLIFSRAGATGFPHACSRPYVRCAQSGLWLLQGSCWAWRLAFSLLRPEPVLSPGLQGSFSPGVLFLDKRPFWARSEGCVCGLPGTKALPRGEAQAGPGWDLLWDRVSPILPSGIASLRNRFRAPPWPGLGSAGLLCARASLWVVRSGKHAPSQNHWVRAFSVPWACRVFLPLLRVNRKE